jgi:hypothetical protein
LNSATNKKLKILQQYCEENYLELKRKYPNIVGLHVDKKVKMNKKMRIYSIVFHVLKKNPDVNYNSIPPYLEIIFLDNLICKIPTDIIERNHFKLQSAYPGCKVLNSISNEIGSCSIFLKKDNDVIAVSNMHVMGYQFITDSISYVPDLGNNLPKVVIGQDQSISGTVFRGAFNNRLDVAFCKIAPADHQKISNIVPGVGKIQGFYNATNNYNKNKEVKVYGNVSKLQTSRIKDVSTTLEFDYSINNRSFYHIFYGVSCLEDSVTSAGDSGGIVIMNDDQIIGIVIGSDGNNTYYLPYIRIKDYFNAIIL